MVRSRLWGEGTWLVLAMAVVLGALIPTLAHAATIPISAPGTLTQAGATYVLSQDVSAPGTAFVIAASGITLDLGGHTVTYNAQPSGSGVYGVTIGSGSQWVNLDDRGAKITNGKIVQGAGATPSSHGVYVYYTNPRNVEISYLNITVSGRDCIGIEARGLYGFSAHHNTINSSVQAITSRTSYDGYAIRLAGNNLAVNDNTIVGGQGGIAIGNSSTNVDVYRNDVSHKAVDTNGFGIICYSPNGARIHENYVHTTDGLGIMVDYNYQNVEVYSNTVDVRMGPKPEYGYGYTAWGMKFRTYPEAATPGNLRVHDNTITSTAGSGLVEATGIGIYDSHPNVNNQYYNNTITAVTTAADKPATGIKVAGVYSSNTGTTVFGNKVTSNNTNIRISTSDGVGQDGIRFVSNDLVKGASPISYHAITIGFWTYGTRGTIFLDTKTENGANAYDVLLSGSSPGAAYSLYMKWYLDLTVADGLGNPVAGAAVAAAGLGGVENMVGVTDAQGKARLELSDYFRHGMTYPPSSTYDAYTPHTIMVSKDGYQTYAQQVTMDASKSLAVTLVPGGGGGSPLALHLSVDTSEAVPGSIVTYTIDYVNNGATTINSVTIVDPIPPACSYVPGTTSLNGAVVTPDPYANGQISVPVGSLAPGAGGTIVFQVRVK